MGPGGPVPGAMGQVSSAPVPGTFYTHKLTVGSFP